jgi:hypothetical protein
VKGYTELKVPGELRERVQILAARQKTSLDRAFEELIRYGLEVYLAEQTAGMEAAGSPSSPLPDQENAV